jgi:2'-5' RNA ligase
VAAQEIRAFIAIQLNDAIRNGLADFSAGLAAQVPPRSVRWVKPAAMHVTLRFLGDTAVTAIPRLQEAMDRAASGSRPFVLQIEAFGCFPNYRRPRVLWVRIGGDIAAVQTVKQDLDDGLAPLGWPPEKRAYKPHLTLGRVKDSRALQNLDWPAGPPPQSLPVAAIHLVESELRPDGPRYTVRHTSYLGQSGRVPT